MDSLRRERSVLRFCLVAFGVLLTGGAGWLLGLCGPFADIGDGTFCPFVLEIFSLGITTGVTPTTYAPNDAVTRLQMAGFLSRTVDRVLQRGNRRSAAKQYWTPQNNTLLGGTTISGGGLEQVESDGADLWVSTTGDTVVRVRGSDGRVLETWTGASAAFGVQVALGRVFVSGMVSPGRLHMINPSLPAGAVTTVASTLGDRSTGIAFDGLRIWTANLGNGSPGTGSVSLITPGASIPWAVSTVSLGFSTPQGALFDGANVWVTDSNLNQILKLSSFGSILQSVTVGTLPTYPMFDGTNIWVPNFDSASVTVLRASSGAVLATLTGNGVSAPNSVAFDGERVLVTNASGNKVSLFKAADLTPIGSFPIAAGQQTGACSDGINFWVAVFSNPLVRF
jgi:hypothetical protein